jgi:hypothetical protein
MNGPIETLIRTNLDLHFGRLAPLACPNGANAGLKQAAHALGTRISQHLLGQNEDPWPDGTVQRHVFDKRNALPQWLVNKGIIACNNTTARLESGIIATLENTFFLRRFLDYVCGELAYHCWMWLDEDKKRHWPHRQMQQLGNNAYCTNLNACPYVIKLNDGILSQSLQRESETYHWYIKSLGTLQLIDYATKPVYEFTARLLESRYKTSFILDVFKDLFGRSLRAKGLDHWGILVLGDIPKTFSLADFAADRQGLGPASPGRHDSITELLLDAMARFDDPGGIATPEARFRLGMRPPQDYVDRAGALFWLRRTLDAVKQIQLQTEVPRQGLQVAERTFLQTAMQQKCIVYCNLFDDGLDAAINPCSIASIGECSMVLQSPRGNKLNDAGAGQEIHGYFSVVDSRRKSTFCDFRTSVMAVTPAGDRHSLVQISLPATFELTRRSHKRLRLDPDQLTAFSLHALPDGDEAAAPGNLDHWPDALCRLPQETDLCQIKDLSAGGLMLELHAGSPAFAFFEQPGQTESLLALLHLAGRSNRPDLVLPLRLAVKRIRHFAPLQVTYLGVQFVETGEIRNQKYVRWQPVGKDGVYLIADWIFRNAIAG